MEWVWELYEGYITRHFKRRGIVQTSEEELESTFIDVLRDSSMTLLVQEPWQGSVRFKCLAKYDSTQMLELISGPMEFLSSRFGGGKFKVNFHHGWNFVATKNFKPVGEPLWEDLPALQAESSL